MLHPITNWNALRDALAAAGLEIYLCEDCGNIWFSSDEAAPTRCSRDGCRAWANSPRRSQAGRPFETCPDCLAVDPKHPRKPCLGGKPHAFHSGQ
jgi:hypothetical protein